MTSIQYFASDNNSGVHPRIMEAMSRVNCGGAAAYGDDDVTAVASGLLQETLGPTAQPWFVFLGTAANVLSLKSMVRPYGAVLCTDTAHIHTDECGAPEAFIGCKLLPLRSVHGKLYPQQCGPSLSMRDSVHSNRPTVLSITQPTECGTVYSLAELKELREYCRTHQLMLHMDGARISNAAATLGVTLREIVESAGVDVLSFGGTKNGLMYGEAVVFFNHDVARDFAYLRKQNMQMASKMRFIAAQFIEFLQDGLWLENARKANSMAALLEREIAGLDHIRIVHPVEVNAIFARLHKDAISRLRERFYFYTFDSTDAEGFSKDWHLVRLMTSFNTKEEQVLEFAAALKACGDIK